MRLQEQIANEAGVTSGQVDLVLEPFARELHKSLFEAKSDPYAQMYWNCSNMAFFHFMGSFAVSAENSDGEFHPEEYLLRLGQAEDWQQFSEQMRNWEHRNGSSRTVKPS